MPALHRPKVKQSTVLSSSTVAASRSGTPQNGFPLMTNIKTQTKQLLHVIEPRWHKAFLRFIATGRGSAAFFAYLDSDERCQGAVDKAIDAQAEIFQKLAKTLRSHV
jgi:hypothetical protein